MPASPSTARAINDRHALRLLQQEGPLTAGQLKQHTGLSRPTVADARCPGFDRSKVSTDGTFLRTSPAMLARLQR